MECCFRSCTSGGTYVRYSRVAAIFGHRSSIKAPPKTLLYIYLRIDGNAVELPYFREVFCLCILYCCSCCFWTGKLTERSIVTNLAKTHVQPH